MPFQYQLASLDDLPQIVAIYNSTVASRLVTADTEPVSVESRLAWFHAHTPEKRPLWVVKDGDTVTGWASYSDFYGRPAYSGTAEVSIYILESQRRCGLGRYFLQAAIEHAPAIGVHTLLGFIFGHNQPSLVLFERFGFTVWGNYPRVAILDGVARDLLVLGLRVDEVK